MVDDGTNKAQHMVQPAMQPLSTFLYSNILYLNLASLLTWYHLLLQYTQSLPDTRSYLCRGMMRLATRGIEGQMNGIDDVLMVEHEG